MAAMGRGCGNTPERIVLKITEEVARIGQNATAKAIGIPLRSVQKYLKSEAEPTNATLQKLADYFGVSVPYLRGDLSYNEMILVKEVEDIYDEIMKLQQIDDMPLEAFAVLDSISDKFAAFAHKRANAESAIEQEEGKRDEIVSKRIESEFEVIMNEIDFLADQIMIDGDPDKKA